LDGGRRKFNVWGYTDWILENGRFHHRRDTERARLREHFDAAKFGGRLGEFRTKNHGWVLIRPCIRGGRGVWSGLATATEAHEWDLDVVCESCGAGGGWGEHEGRVVDTEPQRSKRPLVAPALSGRLSSAPFHILRFAWSSAVPLYPFAPRVSPADLPCCLYAVLVRPRWKDCRKARAGGGTGQVKWRQSPSHFHVPDCFPFLALQHTTGGPQLAAGSRQRETSSPSLRSRSKRSARPLTSSTPTAPARSMPRSSRSPCAPSASSPRRRRSRR
jgi:hypothetical protein